MSATCRSVFKSIANFVYFQKNIYLLFVNIYFVKIIPRDIIHLCQRFFQSSKHFKISFFCILFSSSFDAVFISSIVAQRRLFLGLFSFTYKKKSQRARSGEYGGCSIISVLVLAKKSRTSSDLCGVFCGDPSHAQIID